MNNSIEEIVDILKNAEKIAIAGHTNPDGDAIGSCMGLALALRNMGKTADVYMESFSDTYNCIPGSETIFNSDDCHDGYDLFLAVDCGDKDRLPKKVAEMFDRVGLNANIDHHASNTYFGKLNYVVDSASSASEIVFTILRDDFEIPKNSAGALYAGIIYDTGGLRHTSTSPVTMVATAELMAKGIDFSTIYNEIFNRRSFVEAKLMGKALDRIETAQNGKIVYSFLTKEEIADCGGTAKDVGEIINYIKGVKGALAAVFVYEKGDNESKVSLRGDEPINVAEIAGSFGGGGHVRAAGYTAYTNPENAVKEAIDALEKCF